MKGKKKGQGKETKGNVRNMMGLEKKANRKGKESKQEPSRFECLVTKLGSCP